MQRGVSSLPVVEEISLEECDCGDAEMLIEKMARENVAVG